VLDCGAGATRRHRETAIEFRLPPAPDSQRVSLAPGSNLGPYEILGLLGSGGMGEVYRARDSRLGREVAVKTLPSAVAADPDRLKRLRREAQAIAALNHPHICQLYDVGPDYLVLEYVQGRPLAGPLAPDEAMRLAQQIASALEAAHRHGILHRDLKPGNVIVTADGSAKLLDFGIAKLMGGGDATRTVDGVPGTLAYMSPEHADGGTVDARSDIFSFGAVLYELLSGRRAFEGDTVADVLTAVLRKSPPSLDAPAAVARVVQRCLEKDPRQRYSSMAEVRKALEVRTVAAPADDRASIVVLPFANMSADPENEYFSDGLAEEVIGTLTRVPGLKVIARTSAFAFKGQNTDVRRIADALGVAHVLEGSVRKAGNRVRITAQLISAADGSHVWSERYDRQLEDVFAIQDDIAQAIAAALPTRIARPAATRARYTPRIEAYEAFLRGQHHLVKFTPDGWTKARACFETAIAFDPKFARPHAELGSACLLAFTNGTETDKDLVQLVRQSARRALELDPTDSGPHSLLGALAAAYDYDWAAAGEHFRQLLDADQLTPNARWAYSSFYLQPLGRFEEGLAEMQAAVADNPLNVPWQGILSVLYSMCGRYDDAIANAERAIEIEPNWVALYTLAEANVYAGRIEEALAVAERCHAAAPWHTMPTGLLAGILHRRGERERAGQVARRFGDSPYPVWGRVLYHLLCSDVDAAAKWYRTMIERRDPFAVVFAAAPVAKPLRETRHWPALAQMMNLPGSG
jgi:eukaryotic-like serine/threonine-protein kinase